MGSGPKTTTPPDGAPWRRAKKGERIATDGVTEVHRPIAGDAGKHGRRESGEAAVDEAGQIRRRNRKVDLLH